MAEPARRTPADWETQPAPEADPFRYGWRPKYVRLPSGDVTEQQIPLTAEDLLDPQLGDVVVQSGPHYDFCNVLSDLLKRHFDPREDVIVVGDMKMLWGVPGLPEPAPDVAVISGVRDKHEPRSSFDVVREGTRPCLVLEVASSMDPAMRRNDYEEKVEIYRKAGVPEYVILDPASPATRGRLLLTGYRLDASRRYRRIEPDGQGRLLSETTKLLFGVAPDGVTLQVIDTETGERLLSSREEQAGRRAEAEARRAAEDEVARLRAEIERLKKGLP